MSKKNQLSASRRKILKGSLAAGISFNGLSGITSAKSHTGTEQTSPRIEVLVNNHEILKIKSQYQGEPVFITEYKQGPKEGKIEFHGADLLDGVVVDKYDTESPSYSVVYEDKQEKVVQGKYKGTETRFKEVKAGKESGKVKVLDQQEALSTTQDVSTMGALDVVERQNTFHKRIGSCHAWNYQHRYVGLSFELSRPADIVGKNGLEQLSDTSHRIQLALPQDFSQE